MKKGTLGAKALGALIGALLFYIIGSGPVYGLTDKLWKAITKKKNVLAVECPALKGVMRPTKVGRIVHTVVFALVVLLLMEL